MLRNDLTDGLLVWLPTNDESEPALVLDRANEGFHVFEIDKEGDVSGLRTFDTLKEALVYYASVL